MNESDRQKYDTLWREASVHSLEADRFVLKQHKDKHGVCIIPEEQDRAVCALIALIGRGEPTDVTGSKHGDLTYAFAPPLTEEEFEQFG